MCSMIVHKSNLAGLDYLSPLLEPEFSFSICDFINFVIVSFVSLDFSGKVKKLEKV